MPCPPPNSSASPPTAWSNSASAWRSNPRRQPGVESTDRAIDGGEGSGAQRPRMGRCGIAEGGCWLGLPTFAAGAVLTAAAVGPAPDRDAAVASTALLAVPILIQLH